MKLYNRIKIKMQLHVATLNLYKDSIINFIYSVKHLINILVKE